MLRCIETWPEAGDFAAESLALELGPGEGLPGRVWAAEAPAWLTGVPTEGVFPRAGAATRAGLQSAFAFPVRGAALIAVIEFFTADLRGADEPLLGR